MLHLRPKKILWSDLTGKREKNLSAALRTHPKRCNFADIFAIRIFYEYNMGPGLFWELFFPFSFGSTSWLCLFPCWSSLVVFFLAWWLIFLGWYFPWRSHGNFIAGTPLLDFNRALHRNGGPGWDTLISSF